MLEKQSLQACMGVYILWAGRMDRLDSILWVEVSVPQLESKLQEQYMLLSLEVGAMTRLMILASTGQFARILAIIVSGTFID